jgi:hypothetical protein
MSPFVQDVTDALKALPEMKGYDIGMPRQHPNAAVALIPVNGKDIQITLREWINRTDEQHQALLSTRIVEQA